MSSRLMKQFIFGVFYLAVFGGFIYIVYISFFRGAPSCFDSRRNQGESEIDCGGPCLPCALKKLEPISIFGEPQVTPLDSDRSVVFLQIKNPNADYGADYFSYAIGLYDSGGNKLKTIDGQTFIYPQRIKTLLEGPIDIGASRIAKVDFSAHDFNWLPAGDFAAPQVQNRAIKVEFLKDQAKITGLALNNNSFKLSEVDVVVSAADSFGSRITASKTALKDMEPFQERAFTVFLSLTGGRLIDRNSVEVFVDARR